MNQCMPQSTFPNDLNDSSSCFKMNSNLSPLKIDPKFHLELGIFLYAQSSQFNKYITVNQPMTLNDGANATLEFVNFWAISDTSSQTLPDHDKPCQYNIDFKYDQHFVTMIN